MLAIYGSLAPFESRSLSWDVAIEQFGQLAHEPLEIKSRTDWAANVLLFVPLGYLWSGTLSVDRRGFLANVLRATLITVCLFGSSVALEFAQLWFPQRTVSPNDVCAEAMGGVVGALVWLLSGDRATCWIRQLVVSRDSSPQPGWWLQAYFFGLLLYLGLPFDVTIRPAELWHKYRAGNVRLVPFASHASHDVSLESIVGSWLLGTVLFVPVGMLLATWLVPHGRAVRSVRACLGMGLLLTIAIEIAQLLVYSRFTDVTDVFTETIGVMLGAWLAVRVRPRQR